MKDYNSILKRFSKHYPALYSSKVLQMFCELNVNKIIELLDVYDKENPAKTYAQDFFEKFPRVAVHRFLDMPDFPFPAGYCSSGLYRNDCPDHESLICNKGRTKECARCWNVLL